jgi:DNA-binding winged helix-turn-helix (wHTH) protein
MIFEFDVFELDAALFELRSRGKRLDIQPKALELLLLLVRNRSRVVATGEIFANLWPSIVVGRDSLTKAVYGARRALREGGLRREAIRTVWGRGYSFAEPVLERSGELPSPAPPRMEDAPGGPPPRTFDGVALMERGDVFLVVWKAPATTSRARWMFDEADRFAARMPEGFLALIVVMPSSSPPDYITALALMQRQARLRRSVRRQSHVALGNSLWLEIVVSALRAMKLPVRVGIGPVTISSTLQDGIERLLERRGPSTPAASELRRCLSELFAALQVDLSQPDVRKTTASSYAAP